jgi:hypothetical protein
MSPDPSREPSPIRRAESNVETYSSFSYAVEPRSFEYDGVTHHVASVERQWRTPGQKHFYVRDASDEFFELTYDEPGDVWNVRALGRTCPPRVSAGNRDA